MDGAAAISVWVLTRHNTNHCGALLQNRLEFQASGPTLIPMVVALGYEIKQTPYETLSVLAASS